MYALIVAAADAQSLVAAKVSDAPPAELNAVITELAAAAEPGLVAEPGGRYFGFVIGGSLPGALAADWLAAAWDQNAGLYVGGPAAAPSGGAGAPVISGIWSAGRASA